MKNNIDIPLGKRKPLYRFFEILPGALSYLMVILLFVLSIVWPLMGAIYLLLIVTFTLVRAIATAYRTVQGYNTVREALKVDFRQRYLELSHPHEAYERLRAKKSRQYQYERHLENLRIMAGAGEGEYPDPEKIYHVVIMTAYDEGFGILDPSVKAVQESSWPNDKIIMVLAYEERGGAEMEETVKKLKKQYAGVFYDFILSKHPDGIKGEIKGKGPNLSHAGEEVLKYVEKKRISVENVIVTSLDSDNKVSKGYFDYVAYEFVTHRERQHLSYQPVSLFTNNIWDVPAPMRVIAVSNSFFNVITTMRPQSLRNFASHSQPLWALREMGFWSRRTIVEDGHQYWRSLFFFKGDYDVVPVRLPIYQDAVVGETLVKTLKAQFVQLRRWDYGASDVAYVGVRTFCRKTDRPVAFGVIFPKFVRLLEGHVTLAIMSPIVAFGGWVPMLMNLTTREMLAFNLPNVVSTVQAVAAVGLFITILMSLRMLPPRPARYRKIKTVMMVAQWILMPVIALAYTSAAAYYSQTRLMIGKYMEKFDVTKKIENRGSE